MIDPKSGIDLDEFVKVMEGFSDTTPDGRAEGYRLAKLLRAAYPDRTGRPEHIQALLDEFRRLTRFTTYPEDVIIIYDGKKPNSGGQ